MTMSAEHRALHQVWWRLQMSEKFSSGTENLQTNKQTNTKNAKIHKF